MGRADLEGWVKRAFQQKVAKYWAAPASLEEKRMIAWMEHSYVNRHINRRTTGDASLDWLKYVSQKYFPEPVEKALTLGCGEGGLERAGLALRVARFFDAMDISDGAVESASAATGEMGFGNKTKYIVRDLNQLHLEPESYDAIFASMSLHHVQALENLFIQCRGALRSGGKLIVNEYVGPTRFQLSEERLRIINGLIQTLPRHLRRIIRNGKVTGEVKERHSNPPLTWFEENDPSESVRSADILTVMGEHFDVVELRWYGGGLLQFTLENIVGNFREPADLIWLDMLFQVESFLEQQQVISSDFALIIAVPRIRV